jgi:hypothetical protein
MIKVLSTGQCFMARIFGCSESLVPQPYIYQVALGRKTLGCAYDRGPHAQEPDEAKVSSPVLKRRREW